MSKYIKAFATTGSEWDSVNYLLVELREGFLDKLKHYIGLAKKLAETEGVTSINISGDNADFFVSNEDDEDIAEDTYEVIELDNLDNLEKPEQSIRYGKMRISSDTIIFVAHGKHTDEEFWGSISNDYILSLEN